MTASRMASRSGCLHAAAAALLVATFAAVPPSALAAASCPALQSGSVEAECVLGGRKVDCASLPAAPGTRATFRCRPLHRHIFGYEPAGGRTAECGDDGQWTERPFRCVPVCGQPTGRPLPLVRLGGNVSSSADYPWHVVVYDREQEKEQICGGSLITSKYFVSAAHCFHDNVKLQPADRYFAALGKTRRGADVQEDHSQFREIAKINVKDYGAEKNHYANDIALVQFAKEVQIDAWALPVCVDWGLRLPDIRDDEEGIVVGFGNSIWKPSDVLLVAKLPFHSSGECKKSVPKHLAVFTSLPDKFCVGFVNGTSVTRGDSGGGMAFKAGDSLYLRGVVSVGDWVATTHSFFTHVRDFIPWIASVIQLGEVNGRRCGVDVSEAVVKDGAATQPHDFPWEVDVYYKPNGGREFERLWPGVLVQNNLVITTLAHASERLGRIDLSEYPAAWLRVAPHGAADALELSKASNVSEVTRVFYPDDIHSQSQLSYNLILIELKQPLNLMPVCVDWTGNALPHDQVNLTLTTLFEKPSEKRRLWRRFTIDDQKSCKFAFVSSVRDHNFCTLRSKEDPKGDEVYSGDLPVSALSRALLVSVDNTWYLSGVYSKHSQLSPQISNISNAILYTNMSHPGVLAWLARTRDMVGKPSCGDFPMCGPLTRGHAVTGHLPWTVAVDVIDSVYESSSTGSGVLIQPNIVLTDCEKGRPAYLDLKSVAVRWTDADGRLQTSKVKSVHSTRSRSTFIKPYNVEELDVPCVVLLELHPEDAIPMTPACVDLRGDALQAVGPGQLGLVESWSEWSPAQHSLVSASYVGGGADCVGPAGLLGAYSVKPKPACATVGNDTFDDRARGAGYVTRSGSKWFLQGLVDGQNKWRGPENVLQSVDFRQPEVRSWLRTQLASIPLAAVTSQPAVTAEPKNCPQGGRPSPGNRHQAAAGKCGIFRPTAGGGQRGRGDVLSYPTEDHMEWNVDVHVDEHVDSGGGQWKVRSGTLVSTTMVLTASHKLEAAIPASSLAVKYISADRVRNSRIAEVKAVHVRGALALLELESAVPLMPLCVSAPGSIGQLLSPLSDGARGLVEVWKDTETSTRLLVPTTYLTKARCQILMPYIDKKLLTDDRFCVQSSGISASLGLGASYAMQTKGLWYLRGVQAIDWRKEKGTAFQDLYSFLSVDDTQLLAWLTEKIGSERHAAANYGNKAVTAPEGHAASLQYSRDPTTPQLPQPTIPLPTESSPECGRAPGVAAPANGSAVPGRFPWSVSIRYRAYNGRTKLRPGVLLRTNFVLTAGHNLVTDGLDDERDPEKARLADADQLTVFWLDSDGDLHSTGVLAVHAHVRESQPRDAVHWDVGLLELRKPIDAPLPCLDLLATGARPSPRDQVGVMETWRREEDFYYPDRLLVGAAFVAADDCLDGLTADRFCTPVVDKITVGNGAGFFLRSGDLWQLRGIKSFRLRPKYNGMNDLFDTSIINWLREKLKVYMFKAHMYLYPEN